MNRFQSTLPRRERPDVQQMGACTSDFNPRSREGSDQRQSGSVLVSRISIHAPAKGATINLRLVDCSSTFQSTLPRRERHAAELERLHRDEFQSTLPRRERPVKSAQCVSAIAAFQSTLPRRERPRPCRSRAADERFQSTLPRRERRTAAKSCPLLLLFQSTLPRRERLDPEEVEKIAKDFNPRSREGSDSRTNNCIVGIRYFNPRSREGSDDCP